MGTWIDIPFSAVTFTLLPHVLRMWNCHGDVEVRSGLGLLAEAVLQRPGVGILDLACWIEESYQKAGVGGPQLPHWENPDLAAAVLALRVSESPVFSLRP